MSNHFIYIPVWNAINLVRRRSLILKDSRANGYAGINLPRERDSFQEYFQRCEAILNNEGDSDINDRHLQIFRSANLHQGNLADATYRMCMFIDDFYNTLIQHPADQLNLWNTIRSIMSSDHPNLTSAIQAITVRLEELRTRVDNNLGALIGMRNRGENIVSNTNTSGINMDYLLPLIGMKTINDIREELTERMNATRSQLLALLSDLEEIFQQLMDALETSINIWNSIEGLTLLIPDENVQERYRSWVRDVQDYSQIRKEEREVNPVQFQEIQKTELCSICLETTESLGDYGSLSCSHVFHKACLNRWAKNNNTCPICRHVLTRST